MIYGLARISIQEQSFDSQVDQLVEFGVDKIARIGAQAISGQKQKINEFLLKLTPGDTLVVTRIDRIGRDAVHFIHLIEKLREKGIHLVILNRSIDTRTVAGEFFLTAMAELGEMEREIIKEKQRFGTKVAKQNGKYRGRVKKYTENHPGMNHALELRRETNKTVKEICAITGVSQATFYRRLRAIESD